MSLTAGDILDLASELLGDQAKILHPDALLLEFLNDGQRAIVSTVPEAGARAAVAHLESGIYQVFPSAGQRLLDMPRNVTPSILAIAVTDASKAEGNSGTTNFTFAVTRTGDTSGTASATWAVTGSGANPASAPDFVGGTLPTGTVTFTAGQTTQTITVPVQGDTTVEPDNGFTVTISNPVNAFVITASTTAAGTIQNDDTQLDIAATDAVKSEGDSGTTNFTFTVTRTGVLTGTCSADWAVTGGGANPANAADFVGAALPSGTVSFTDGESSKVITVAVQGDTDIEESETFTVTLSNPVNATLGTATADGTIQADDFRGYFAGGNNIAAVIDGISLTDESAFTSSAALTVGRQSLAGVNSSTCGYFGGGNTGGGSSEIDGIRFATEAAINPSATLATGRLGLAGVNSTSRGYFGGGQTALTEIDGLQFSNEAAINPSATLATGRSGLAGVNSSSRGYFCGGATLFSGGASAEIDGIQFSDETAINPSAALTVARYRLAGVNSSANGYVGGGFPGGAESAEIDGIQFSNESAINPSAALSVARYGLAGVNSSTKGYFGGGFDSANVDVIDGIQFSDESAVTVAATLSLARIYLAGLQSGGIL
jgi:hypothetical protein